MSDAILNELTGKDAVLRIAMIELINKNIDKFRILCAGCGQCFKPEDMQLKKAPGKIRFYLTGRCNKCSI